MKIAFVLDDGLDNEDGVQKYVLTLGGWLSRSGHEVHYLAGQTKRTDINTIHSLARTLKVRFNRNYVRTPLPTKASRIHKLLEQEKYDIVHVQMPYSPLLSGKIIKYLGADTPLVGTFHIVGYSAREKAGARALGALQRQTLARFDKIFSVSDAARDYAKQCYQIDSAISPNVVDFNEVKKHKASHSSQKTIVFVGRLVARKGAFYLLKAAKKLNERGFECQFQICGSGPLMRKLQSYKHKHGLKNVRFLGRVSEAEKFKRLSTADIAVFPSTGGESFGIVLIEAMCAGAGVVLGGQNPGYQTVLREWPLTLFDPTNTLAFADRLEMFLNNSKRKQTIHASQQKAVLKYDVAKVGPKMLATYKELINTKRRDTAV